MDLNREFADVPGWLLVAIHSKKEKTQSNSESQKSNRPVNGKLGPWLISNALLEVSKGRARNDAGFWLACQLRDNGFSRNDAERLMFEYVEKVNSQFPGTHPYTNDEAISSLKQAYENGTAREPLTIKAYQLTEGGNADRFIDLNGDSLRYCYDFKKWYFWDSIRWNPDRSGAVEVLAQEMIRAMYVDAANIVSESARKAFIAHVKKSDQAKSIRGMLEMARSRASLLPEQLDRDPFLLCVSNGTIDLRTGKLREHRREDLISRLVSIDYDESATAPTWIRFLNEIFVGKSALISFVQRSFGYGLTGDTREQCIFIPWGKGANGKSTLLNTISDLMGDYAITAATNTFLVKSNDSIPNDVARLRGARLVIAIEVEEGKRLAENMIKQITGGDKVSARFLRQEWFDFDPEFKPFLAVNHKPEIRGTDHAIWRRIKLIPFSVCFEDSKQDKTLKEKLRAEFAGILNWMIEGCLDWQKYGLGEPEEVKEATESYRQEMDTLADFISECCVELDSLSIQAGHLHKAYVTWIKDRGEQPLNMKLFGEKITERGIKKEMPTSGIHKNRWMYKGIGLAAKDDEGGRQW